MELVRWTPTYSLSPFDWDIDDWFGRFFEGGDLLYRRDMETGFCPSAESYTKGNELHLRAEIPGVDPKGVNVSVENGHLCIKGERKRPESAQDSCYCFEEMGYGSFERCFHLSEHVDVEKIHAKYENGILDLTIPLTESATAKKIPIEGMKEEKKESKAA